MADPSKESMMSDKTVEEMRATVLARYPSAISFEWTGYWRIYKVPHLVENSCIGGPCDTEDEAWADAYSKLPAHPAPEAPKEERKFPIGGDPKDFCKCGHHEMCHADYLNMPRSCNQTGCGCNQYELDAPPAAQEAAPLPPLTDATRLIDMVRHQRHELWDAKLITDEEFAALVADADNGQRVARLESYDEMRARLAAAMQEIDNFRSALADNEVRCLEMSEQKAAAEARNAELEASKERYRIRWDETLVCRDNAVLDLMKAEARNEEWELTLGIAGCVKDRSVPCGWVNRRAEVAEARVRTLEAALSNLRTAVVKEGLERTQDENDVRQPDNFVLLMDSLKRADAALAEKGDAR